MADNKISKTNVARILDQKKIHYTLLPYPVDEDDLGAENTANVLHLPLNQLFKTLVLRGDKIGIFVCVIPGDQEVDLKKVAKITGNKSCEMIHQKELLPLTGYIRGGCSPIGMKKSYPTWIHSSCCNYDIIYISAGMRGLMLSIVPHELVRIVPATIADLIRS